MKEIILYQLKDGVSYRFMNYNYSKDLINMEDYEEVLYFTSDSSLEEIFIQGNNGALHNAYPDVRFHSISVSDIIEVDGEKYFVDSFGFQKLEEEE